MTRKFLNQIEFKTSKIKLSKVKVDSVEEIGEDNGERRKGLIQLAFLIFLLVAGIIGTKIALEYTIAFVSESPREPLQESWQDFQNSKGE